MLDQTLLSNPCLPATELSQHDTSNDARLLARTLLVRMRASMFA
jgi:hypothetical protein